MNQTTIRRIEALEASAGQRRIYVVDDARLWPETYTSEQAERLARPQDTIIRIEWFEPEAETEQTVHTAHLKR